MSNSAVEHRRRWLALTALCLGELLIVIDSTIVNVALPSIRSDLGFTPTSLVWVVNAFMLTFGGFLLLGGRLGDFYGQRRIFLSGIALFTVASLACGLAQSPAFLVGARAWQGVTAAIVSAVALALIFNLFPAHDERAKAMGFYGFVMAAGGSVGVLLGGALTDLLNWHWIFLVNVPIGIFVFLLSRSLLPADARTTTHTDLDVPGAVTITLALMLAVYAIVDGNEAGWLSAQTLGMSGIAAVLFGAFLVIEMRTKSPLMPLSLFRRRNTAVANAIGVLWAVAMFTWFFITALYLQGVLAYSPMEVGLAFLPTNIIMAAFSLGLSARIVMRYGIRMPIVVGLALSALGLALFAFAPEDGTFLLHVMPGMCLLGIGTGVAFNPVLLAAMSDVDERESGLASGVVNTSFMMGGAVGLAVIAAAAAGATNALLADGIDARIALNGGYQVAFALGAVCCAVAAALGVFLRAAGSPPVPSSHA